MSNEITSRSITLRTESGQWLGQIVLTSDGMFASVTDYGNLSVAWRSFTGNFEDWIVDINVSYFGQCLYSGLAYIIYNRKAEQACYRFAEIILPALQDFLRKEKEEKQVKTEEE